MSERYVDDADWSTAAEQSSEDDEAQEGNVLADQERSAESAEHAALHIEDDEPVDEEPSGDDAVVIEDPEADAVVNDALEIDQADEAEAAAEVLTESLADEEAERAAEAADEVAPYDGPELGDESDDVESDDPYEAFRQELRSLEGKWSKPRRIALYSLLITP